MFSYFSKEGTELAYGLLTAYFCENEQLMIADSAEVCLKYAFNNNNESF